MSEDDYLDPEDQEVNESINEEEIQPNLNGCSTSEELRNMAKSNGLIYPAEEQIKKAVEDIKELIYLEFFQNGTKEQVHDMNVMNKYVNFLGLLHKVVLTFLSSSKPINFNRVAFGQSAELKNGMSTFFEIFRQQMNMSSTKEQDDLRDAYLHLHFICYPYCHADQCLSMD